MTSTRFQQANIRSISSHTGSLNEDDFRSGNLHAENKRLRTKLSAILDQIDAECDQMRNSRRQTNRASLETRSAPEMRRELESLHTALARKKAEVERVHQGSSMRVVEDHIRALRKKLQGVENEIAAQEQVAQQQRAVLARAGSTALMQDLEDEIANQRRLHSELRRASTEVEQMLRVKQRVCAQLELQVAARSTVESSRRSARQRTARLADIELLETEKIFLETEISALKVELSCYPELDCEYNIDTDQGNRLHYSYTLCGGGDGCDLITMLGALEDHQTAISTPLERHVVG